MEKFRTSAERKRISALGNNKQYGIVFPGGGAKGAFQIGVWKYLHEYGYDQWFTGISGTSVGALNSLLFASGSYENAERTWLNVQQKDITPPDFNPVDLSDPKGFFINSLPPVVALKVAHALSKKFARLSLYSQDGLKKLITNSSINWPNVHFESKLIYSTLSQKTPPHGSGNDSHKFFSRFSKPEYRCWAGLDNQDVIDTVLGSASIPFAYPSQHISGKNYKDGGIYDNIPIRPLVQAHFETILVIHLSRAKNLKFKREWDESIAGLADDPTVSTHVYQVFPPDEFEDGCSAMLTVNPPLSRQRIEQGYQAACKQLFDLFPPRIIA